VPPISTTSSRSQYVKNDHIDPKLSYQLVGQLRLAQYGGHGSQGVGVCTIARAHNATWTDTHHRKKLQGKGPAKYLESEKAQLDADYAELFEMDEAQEAETLVSVHLIRGAEPGCADLQPVESAEPRCTKR